MSKWYNDREIEEILFDYPMTKAEAVIDQEQLNNLFPSCTPNYSGEPHGSGISNQTAAFGCKRADFNSMASKRVRAIEIAYEALNADCKMFVQKYYYQRKRTYQVCTEMNISERYFYNLRRMSLNVFAKLLLAKVAN